MLFAPTTTLYDIQLCEVSSLGLYEYSTLFSIGKPKNILPYLERNQSGIKCMLHVGTYRHILVNIMNMKSHDKTSLLYFILTSGARW